MDEKVGPKSVLYPFLLELVYPSKFIYSRGYACVVMPILVNNVTVLNKVNDNNSKSDQML